MCWFELYGRDPRHSRSPLCPATKPIMTSRLWNAVEFSLLIGASHITAIPVASAALPATFKLGTQCRDHRN